MLSPKDNPPIASPDAPVSSFAGVWYVGHTKARFEKAFAWDLLRLHASYFLPMVERLTFSGGRKRKGLMPLFPGYVFFAGEEQTRYSALATDRLCQVIQVKDQATLVRELSSLQLALQSKAALDPYPYAVVGSRCRVAAGPFEGIEGTVVQREGLFRLVLQVGLLGQSVAMEIDPAAVEPIE